MVTIVGLSPNFDGVLKSLIALDFDAAEAYEAAIERLEHDEFKRKMEEFRQDHLRHTQELSELAEKMGLTPPEGPGAKQILAKGKVVMADLFGDKAILMAMKTNEEDTNTAYERACNHKDLPPEAVDILQRGLADERRHRAWIIDTLEHMKAKAA